MKKFLLVTILVAIFYPAAVNAQTPSECSSIEQKAEEGPVIIGEESPANVLMALREDGEIAFIVNANPGYSLDFIQLVYEDSVGTRIVMPATDEDFSTGWQTSFRGDFRFYKVSGCKAWQASTSTTSTSTALPVPLTISSTITPKETSNINPSVPVPVVAVPAFTG